MLDIADALRRSPAVRQVQVIDLIDEATVKYLQCRAEMADGSIINITESTVVEKNKYSYHWQDAQNQLIVRWDNAPHHPRLASFPHHRHERGAVHESPRVSIAEVLIEIEAHLRKSGVLS